jgi:hypothetical protein
LEYAQEPENVKISVNAKNKILSLQEAISKVGTDFKIQTEDNYCLKPAAEIPKENSDPSKAHGLTLGYGKCGFII